MTDDRMLLASYGATAAAVASVMLLWWGGRCGRQLDWIGLELNQGPHHCTQLIAIAQANFTCAPWSFVRQRRYPSLKVRK